MTCAKLKIRVRDHIGFFHSINKVINRRGERWDTIKLSSKLTKCFEKAGELLPITISKDMNDTSKGRYIEISVKINESLNKRRSFL